MWLYTLCALAVPKVEPEVEGDVGGKGLRRAWETQQRSTGARRDQRCGMAQERMLCQ